MTQQKYRTHQGRTIDLGALILKNETVRAVGNMGVNARGDRLDADNRPIDSRVQRISRQYRRQTTNVVDQPVTTNRTAVPDTPTKPVATAPQTQETTEHTSAPSDGESLPQGGLAAAIARAQRDETKKRAR